MNRKSTMETYILPYEKQIARQNFLYDTMSSNWCFLTTQSGGMDWEVGWRFKREWTYLYLWLLHIVIWQKPTHYCKAIILQLKVDKLKKKKCVWSARLWRDMAGHAWTTERPGGLGGGERRISTAFKALLPPRPCTSGTLFSPRRPQHQDGDRQADIGG